MNNLNPSVLLISVDAFNPDFIFNQRKWNVSLRNINKYFIENGTYASKGVKSVFPTFTYPCHQSIITGTNPATHGTFNNAIFDPIKEHKDAWHWFVNDRVKNLWQIAKENNYLSSSVAFPTSVGAQGDYIAPEFWWNDSSLDSLFINSLATPQGLIAEMEKDIGTYPGGLDLTIKGDNQRYKATMWMIENKIKQHISNKPFFLTTYFASYDEMSHNFGVGSKEAIDALERIDTYIGELVRRVHELTNEKVVVCLVSDHGMIDNKYNICPNVLLKKAGLIKVDKNDEIIDYLAWAQRAGGTCEIRLKNKNDKDSLNILKNILTELVEDNNSGISKVLNGKEAFERGGFPMADFVLISKAGYEIREDHSGPYLTEKVSQKAQHGYDENYKGMYASFLIEGYGIQKNDDVGKMNLVDIAPTLGYIMGVSLPDTEGVNILR